MLRRLVTRDSVAVTGSAIGLLSLLLGWLTLKPSRITAGTSLNIWEAQGWDITAIILVLWLICLGLSLNGRSKLQAIVLGVVAKATQVRAILH